MTIQDSPTNDATSFGTQLVIQGSENAISGLAQMVDQEILMSTVSAQRVSVDAIPEMFGGREMLAVAVYLAVTGSADGHMFLLYPPTTALALADLLLGQPPNTTNTIEEMETSALGEMGNVMGSFYLNALADASGLVLMPSPPAVITDMAGAILDVAMADILLEADDALVVETSFATADRQVTGSFLVIPSPHLMTQLVERSAS